jgi:hypothetical protein
MTSQGQTCTDTPILDTLHFSSHGPAGHVVTRYDQRRIPGQRSSRRTPRSSRPDGKNGRPRLDAQPRGMSCQHGPSRGGGPAAQSAYGLAGMSSTIAWNVVVPVTLAAVTAAVGGSPPPSQARWSLDPGLPRSTGFAPTWSPALGAHAHGVHARPRPVQPALLAQAVQHLEVELVEHPSVGPLGQAAPAGRRRAAAKLPGWQQLPRGRGAGHVDDRSEPLRSGMVRTRPPHQGRGGGGSSGSTIAHSSSGTSLSTRVVMGADHATTPQKERNGV